MNTQTPLAITKEILEFAKQISPLHKPFFINITPTEHARPMSCFENVDQQIDAYGGRVVYGWNIYVWPRVLCEFEFHALWLSPTGALCDISPRPDKEPDCLFLRDDARQYTGQRVQNIRFSLSRAQEVTEYIAAADAFDKIVSQGQTSGSTATVNRAKLVPIFSRLEKAQKHVEQTWRPQRNDPCPCGSRLKYKMCHGNNL
jgi:hypothetical protein